jgi:predicted transporter
LGTALLILGGLLIVGAGVQGVRRWQQGDRTSLLIPLGVCVVALLLYVAGALIAPHVS